jgi:plasmid stabilization system protein ParE
MAKLEVEWSLEARQDLIDILEFYIERNKSNIFSIKLNDEFNNIIELLADYPHLGLSTQFPNVHCLIKSHFQILYEIFDKYILIVMIWDNRQSPENMDLGSRIR